MNNQSKIPKELPFEVPDAFIIEEIKKEKHSPANDRQSGYYLPTLEDMDSLNDLPIPKNDKYDVPSDVTIIEL